MGIIEIFSGISGSSLNSLYVIFVINPVVSIIIPTLNGGKVFRKLLEQLSIQSVRADELLVVDSGSNDETVNVAAEFGATIIEIPKQEFDHGATRSMAARRAKGNILLFFTQDAVPATADVIEKLIEPLIHDATIALSYGRQLPNNDASLSATALRIFNYPPQSVVREFSDREKLGLKTAFVSNSCAAYERSCLEEVSFFPESLIFGEDTCTAGRLLERGYKIAYVAEAAVFHSHNYTLIQEFRRSFDIGVLHRSEQWLCETFGRAEGEGLKYIKYELSMLLTPKMLYQLPLFFCRNLTKFLGYKFGTKYGNLPQWILPKLSMNSSWWHRNVTR
ncbi:MAG TPA: glycosyltransferase [Desulfobacterales bacterium]|nr:glycosyltransferase [Desulfobacterales bacterium]HIP38423.1 glycosyltransferase [Desulfocapsa sulfexigens]